MKSIAKMGALRLHHDPAALFKRLGLVPADGRPILQGLREANARWRQVHRARIARCAGRIERHLRRFSHPRRVVVQFSRGKRRAVWCVELRRRFASLTTAAKFVRKSPANISQSIKRGCKAGGYHWEDFDPAKHGRCGRAHRKVTKARGKNQEVA